MARIHRYVLMSRTTGAAMSSTTTRKMARKMKRMMAFEPAIYDTVRQEVIR